jgi:two-component sensor histidine kinase/predicted hydrocarbon binding protein
VPDKKELIAEIKQLKFEIKKLKAKKSAVAVKTVSAPENFREAFDKAQETVGGYFEQLSMQPEKGTIEINNQRYVLVRASSLSHEFFQAIRNLYSDRPDEEAALIGNNFLFDIAHLIGLEDAKDFHKRMNLTDPIAKLSAGPVHFAYTGWAYVNILPESHPSPDDNFYLKYTHPYSFEADSWVKNKKNSKTPVCIMNSGYSSGWCEASFGIPLTSVEISCTAKGDDECCFIMAPPHKIESYLKSEHIKTDSGNTNIPSFFERKKVEEQLKESLHEKNILLKEIHHRVKNNLQIISSLLNLQSSMANETNYKSKFSESIGRIKAMALIHEMLYGSKDFSNINFVDYLNKMIAYQISSLGLADQSISVVKEIKLTNNSLEIDTAIPCALIINELLTNAIKHAFKGRDEGKISIEIEELNEGDKTKYQLIFFDNGVGLPDSLNIESAEGLGMELVNTLSAQLDGKLEVDNTNGTRFTLQF